jgi:hypothetical protein
MNSRLKSGINNAGDCIIFSLILSKYYFYLDPHLNSTFIFIMSCMGFIVSTKLGMNHLTKFILPKNDCMDFLL